ncbi:MAG TPA: formimidoylglutamate deiminase [Rhodanobacteraceae bacterium]|nr:formimidoylglutamate deiminase [Rhodanobacteraceae bacterium]
MQGEFHADHLFTPAGWSRQARLRVEHGRIAAPAADTSESGGHPGRFVLPGMPNLHSHAFQRAMAGLAERRGSSSARDSFWTWREAMYSFASAIDPDDLRAIAAQLYVEMLKAGYTHVCEFHYLHHAPDGKPYADPAVMSLAIVEAAKEAGIGLTLLPVLYMTGGFDGRPLGERQRRFGMDVESYLRVLGTLRALESPMLRVGVALHSLRAVPEYALREVLASPLARGGMIHIHIAEQTGEVEECVAMRGARPVRWLFDHADVDARWCLVHATHLDAGEMAAIAKSGAVAGLCPTTEANLGDGLFPLAGYLDANGALGIGSDSHISVSPVEELRWLEYGQRLITRQRNIAARAAGASVGEILWQAALRGGAQASGIAPFGEGARADLLVLDDQSPLLAARDESNVLDSFIFAGNVPLVRDVMVNGEWIVRDSRHRDEEGIAMRYRDCVERITRYRDSKLRSP